MIPHGNPYPDDWVDAFMDDHQVQIDREFTAARPLLREWFEAAIETGRMACERSWAEVIPPPED